MSEEIISKEVDLELEHALNKITEHVYNKNFYYKSAYSIQKSNDLHVNFENQNQRRSYYLESNFNNCNLNGTGFTDSIFKNVTFNNCILNNANFESSYFFNCYFQNDLPYTSTSFNKSFIYQSTFQHIAFNQCRLSDITLNNSTIEGCDFDNTAFDGTIFNNTILDTISFKNLNLEYVQFNNVHFNNTSLPFATIPFIINGISYLKSTSDNVTIKSAKKGQLSKAEYIDIIPYLKTFYKKTKNYFPLANIYIAEDDGQKAFETIKDGMYQSIFLNNYRQLKYYCILAGSCDLFNIHQKKAFVDVLSKEFNHRMSENSFFYSPIVNHFAELKNILLNCNDASLIITFKTNIDNENYSVLSLFYKTINLLVGIVGIKANYSINFTYNSNAEIVTVINSLDPSVIVALITAITTIFIAGIKGVSQLPEVINKFATIKGKIKEENFVLMEKQLEIQKTQLEIQKSKLEIIKLQDNIKSNTGESIDQLINGIEPVLKCCDELNHLGVYISDINYNAVNISADTLTNYTSNLIFNEQNKGE